MPNYESLFDSLIANEKDVSPGVMMREPALKCNGKVFMFYYEAKGAMCFKLGKNYPIEEHGIREYAHLSPFKKKPPMTAWYLVGGEYEEQWASLAEVALQSIRG